MKNENSKVKISISIDKEMFTYVSKFINRSNHINQLIVKDFYENKQNTNENEEKNNGIY